ncbi:hydantoinase/oxoprolinase family protein [Deinococcus yavapaiensis]|uniref:N-methylhydantoinase A/oxoprolinase/acetone carboxylase beta subunit n=1 Tax=Deinococcus yavapaiensis KR-236 TaxID=694435 RepID=A0A318SBR4_9DEIO|nr:hydantoinase/oxoprolinase family protein [Deinococcus yavapaiensis]PYE54641.1 N-methylhydantoinase A/oxoprolinase/acetone carboxylase beta subunit [Deinococcus yavapaiensis KR-236]
MTAEVTLPVRIGIDVGGTFTKGVALDPAGQILAVSHVPTTHRHDLGVAAGVLEALRALLRQLPPHARPMLVAHSTTQATNALLERDTALVGILALGDARDERRVNNVTRPPAGLHARHAFVATNAPDFDLRVQAVLDAWRGQGVGVVAVSQAFGVDDASFEQRARDLARSADYPVTLGSDLSGAYGLEMRTLSATVNASILPTMIRTARHVRNAVHELLPNVPLLIVRGDGGAADLRAFEETPLNTVVSGPAASLGGAILSHGVMDGVFFEVGGTSTNIGVIKDGQPALKYMTVMDVPTGLRAADIRIAGVAGGSLVRLKGRRIEDVGPRSAHIAGLAYASFTPPELLVGASLELIAPAPGDPADYAVLRTSNGARYAITPTCAANALGAIPEGGYAHAQRESARIALALLGKHLGASMEAAAQAVLEASAEKLTQTVHSLTREYGLRGAPIYGGGGAASVLGPVVARRLGASFLPIPHSDVISSIGAALAVIRVERERSVTRQDPTVADLLEREVGDEAVRLGADPASLRVETEYSARESRLRAVATGAHPLSARTRALDADELQQQARQVLGDQTRLVFSGAHHSLFVATRARRVLLRRVEQHAALVLDNRGVRLLRFEDALVLNGTPHDAIRQLTVLLAGRAVAPHVAALTASRLRDYAHLHEPAALLRQMTDNLRLEGQVALIVEQ